MGATGQIEFGSGRIANASRVWQGAEDADVTWWDKTAALIVAAAFGATKGAVGESSISLQWRKLPSGSWTSLTGSGELTDDATTDLVNGNAVTAGEAGCSAPGGKTTWLDGVEIEGGNRTGFTFTASNEWTEFQWAINPSGADDGAEFEVRLWDHGEGVGEPAMACTITMSYQGAVVVIDDMGGSCACDTGTLIAACYHKATGEIRFDPYTAVTACWAYGSIDGGEPEYMMVADHGVEGYTRVYWKKSTEELVTCFTAAMTTTTTTYAPSACCADPCIWWVR